MNLLSRRSVSPSPPLSMSRCIRARRRLRPRLWLRVTNCRRVTWRHCFRGWSTPRSSRAFADRAAATNSRGSAGDHCRRIVRTAMSLSTADPEDLGTNSVLLDGLIDPAVRRRAKPSSPILIRSQSNRCARRPKTPRVLDDEKVGGDFAI